MLVALLIGFAAGFVGTLLGIGGGSLATPVLTLLGVPVEYAVPAGLSVVVGTGCGGLAHFMRKGLVRVRIAILLEVFTVVGAFMGAYTGLKLPGSIVYWAIIAALLLSGTVTLLYERLRVPGGLPAALLVSMLAGFISALTGIGGGVLKMPILLTVVGLEIHEAIATSKLMVLFTALTGLTVYATHGRLLTTIALPALISAWCGATIAARVATKLRRKTLKKIASTLYMLLALTLLLTHLP